MGGAPVVDDGVQVGQHLVEVLHHDGALPEAAAKKGHTLRVRTQTGVQIAEAALQEVLLQPLFAV